MKLITFICIFLIFTSFGCLGEEETVEETTTEVIEDPVRIFESNFELIGKYQIDSNIFTYVYYDSHTDFLHFKVEGQSVYDGNGLIKQNQGVSYVCVSTIPEPQQSRVREYYGI